MKEKLAVLVKNQPSGNPSCAFMQTVQWQEMLPSCNTDKNQVNVPLFSALSKEYRRIFSNFSKQCQQRAACTMITVSCLNLTKRQLRTLKPNLKSEGTFEIQIYLHRNVAIQISKNVWQYIHAETVWQHVQSRFERAICLCWRWLSGF